MINNKKLWAALGGAALLAAAAIPALAATEQGVTATVTPQVVSVTVADGGVAYGILSLSPSAGSPTTKSTVDLVDTQVITNAGNVNEDFAVKSTDATGGTAWNLVAAASISTDAFGHQYSTDGTTFTDFPSSNGYTADIITNKAPAATANLDTKILMPTASTDASTQKTITVTVLATAT